MKSSYTSTYYVCVLKLCYVACRRPVYVCAAPHALHITDGEFLGYPYGLCALCIENQSSNEARDLHQKFAINCRGRLGFLFTLQKIAVSDPARGSNPTFLLGQKRRLRPASRGWWFAFTLGEKGESDSPLGSNPRAGAKCKRGTSGQIVGYEQNS